MCHQHGSSLVRHSFLSSCEERNCNPCSTYQLCQPAVIPSTAPTITDICKSNSDNNYKCNVLLTCRLPFQQFAKNSFKREATSVTVIPKVLVPQFLWLYYCFTPITCILIPSLLSCNPFIARLCPV